MVNEKEFKDALKRDGISQCPNCNHEIDINDFSWEDYSTWYYDYYDSNVNRTNLFLIKIKCRLCQTLVREGTTDFVIDDISDIVDLIVVPEFYSIEWDNLPNITKPTQIVFNGDDWQCPNCNHDIAVCDKGTFHCVKCQHQSFFVPDDNYGDIPIEVIEGYCKERGRR